MPSDEIFEEEEIPTFDELLGNLEDEYVEELSKYLQKLEFINGEFIFHEGDESNALFIIQSGKVEISKMDEDGQEYVPLVSLQEGNILGEVSFIRRTDRSANAIATDYTEVYKLPRDDFNAIVEQNPSLACKIYDAILQVLAYRLHRTDNQLIKLTDEETIDV